MRRMRRTGALFILGTVAIAGLPPLNGFVSEWLIYLGLIGHAEKASPATSVLLLLAIGGLCLVGALALFTFARLVGTVLLGEPRDPSVQAVHESSPWMTGPMFVLAALCAGIAVAPHVVVPAIATVTRELLGPEGVLPAEMAPLRTLAVMNCVIATAASVLAIALTAVVASRRPAAAETWACGFVRPTARMQYTGLSFSELLAGRLFPKPLRPRVSAVLLRGELPGQASLSADCADPMTRGLYEPLLSRWADRFARLRWMQQGLLHLYLLYILVAVIALLGWVTFRSWSGS
jgi:NADH:ubiquinone oxidoreductase subunit 5 (subunit L)/multisubunit Na+/H+ antiporter MnhA subunit